MQRLNDILSYLNGITVFHTRLNNDFRFQSGIWLLLLLLLPILWFLTSWIQRKTTPTIYFPGTEILAKIKSSTSISRIMLIRSIHYLAIIFIIIALARPQFGNVERKTFSDGIDIMLISDLSLSMRAQDFLPNRLEASQRVMEKFVDGRIGDRIGLCIFATEAATIVPMTLDYNVVKSFIGKLNFGLVDGNSTAIGTGLATGLKKILESDSKTKIMILLTDGENNAGNIDPIVAAEACKASGVKVYTIGIGSEGFINTPFGRQQLPGIDEETLSKIAKITNGSYFRATDNFKLAEVYDQINKLEKSKVETFQIDNFREMAPLFIFVALGLFLLEILLKYFVWIKLP